MSEQVQRGFYANASTKEIMDELRANGYEPKLITEEGGATLEEHSHKQSHIIVLRSGELSITLDGKSFAMQPGDLITIPPDYPHAAKAGAEGCDYVWVEV